MESDGFELREEADGLTLVCKETQLRGDFTHVLPRLRPDRLPRELLVRAARVRGAHGSLTAVDATAGLGEDALLLAAAGFDVVMYERNPLTAALLRDTLRRSAALPELSPIVGRMHLIEQDSVVALPQLDTAPDVILLDPMFPARRGGGASKKKLQVLKRLELPCSDEQELLDAALAAKPRKVVVKRPLKGPTLAGMRPSHSIRGKLIRYDCLVLSR